MVSGFGSPTAARSFDRPSVDFGGVEICVTAVNFPNLVTDAHQRIKRRHRLLENHGDRRARTARICFSDNDSRSVWSRVIRPLPGSERWWQ